MIISIINHSDIPDADVQEALRAINTQIEYDYRPYWSIGATLRLEGHSVAKPEKEMPRDMRGHAVLYLWSGKDVDDALGYHDANAAGIPFGFVFTELAKQLKEPWQVTLSHEALELVGDPEVNRLVQGPHPSEKDKYVFYWYEMCDAVQDEQYEIAGVPVSNFVLPLYFTGDNEGGGRNDFLGTVNKKTKSTLTSFGINPGGYVGFFNPETNDNETVSLRGDKRAQARLAAKQKFHSTRRSVRYQRFHVEAAPKGKGLESRIPGTGLESVHRPRFIPTPEGVDVLSRGGGRKP
jgi:hypothetical protein